MEHWISGLPVTASACRWSMRIALVMAAALIMGSASASEHGDTLRMSYGTYPVPRASTDLGLRITVLRRENFNAHGFDVLFVHSAGSPDGAPVQSLVPFFEEGNESASLSTREGADCVLRDFRVTVGPAMEPVVVVAERELGASFIDEHPVRFREFTLRRNPEGTPGRPWLYFEASRSWESANSYCDVGEALQRELGLPDRR